MTKDEYLKRVKEAATTLLTETEAKDWKEENPDGEFPDFEYEKNLYDQLHQVIDSSCESDWEGAVEVLQFSEQNPDYVDPGLYEGCNWKLILVTIAFEVYSWDTREMAEAMFENDEFDEYMMEIKSTEQQIGHFPEIQGYKIPIGSWCIDLHSGIKVLESKGGDFRTPVLSVVFEGRVERGLPDYYIVYAKRVYNQKESSNIQDELEECKKRFGVELYPEEDSSS